MDEPILDQLVRNNQSGNLPRSSRYLDITWLEHVLRVVIKGYHIFLEERVIDHIPETL